MNLTFKALSSGLVKESLLFTVVRNVTWKVGDMSSRIDLESSMCSSEIAVVILARRIANVAARPTFGEYGSVFGKLLLLPRRVRTVLSRVNGRTRAG